MAGHSTVEALAAAVLLAGYALLVRQAGLPRGWPTAARRLRWFHLGPGLMALAAAGVGAASAAAVLGSAPVAAVAILLASAAQLLLALRWLRRPRFAAADRLAQVAAFVACTWLIAWSGALPLAAHLEPGADQLVVLVGEAALVLWLTVGTRRPAPIAPPPVPIVPPPVVAVAAGERVGWGHVGVVAAAHPPLFGAPDGLAGRGR